MGWSWYFATQKPEECLIWGTQIKPLAGEGAEIVMTPAAEIGKMTLKDPMEGVSSPRKVFGLLLFQYGSILYAHI